MKRPHRSASPRALALAAALLAPVAAWSQSTAAGRAAPAASPSAAPSAAPSATPRAPTPYQAAVTRGAAAMHDRGYDAAATAFREAARLDPHAAAPHLYLGDVAIAQGNAMNALTAYREALRVATAEGNDADRGRALLAIAALQETQSRWGDARAAWQEYVTFADAHAAVTYAATGRDRVEVMGRRDTLAQQYEAVRQRIAERLRANASGQTQQAPPGTVRVPGVGTTTSP